MARRMLRMTLPKGWETIAPAFLTSFTSPLRKPMARGRSSTRRVSMQVRTTNFLLGNWSVRKASYSLLWTKERLWLKISERMDIGTDCSRSRRLPRRGMTSHTLQRPRRALGAVQPAVGFFIVDELFLRGVPLQRPVEEIADVRQLADGGRASADFRRADGVA